ncbi:cytochrome P450 family protein [Pseudonocardia sichuanensis]
MTDVDLWNEQFRADPYSAYARLREETPVYRAAGGMGFEIWLITRQDAARAALTDPRLASHPRHAPQRLRDRGIFTAEAGPAGVNMLSADAPDHTRLRRLVSKAFTRRRIEALRPRVQEVTDALADAMTHRNQQEDGAEVDLIAALAFPLPITVICELLGVPGADRDHFQAWSRAMIEIPLADDKLALRGQAQQSLHRYLDDLVARKRSEIDRGTGADDQPDLVSALVVAADERDQLTDPELLGMIMLLLIAGHETTVNLIGNGMLALLRHPDQMKLLRAQPELLPSAVEELLRYDGPVERSTMRFATEDVEIGGVRIPAGSVVSVVLAAADRDPAHAPGADQLDITRADHGHLAFGHGIHYCLGAPLARLEGEVAIGTLLRRFPDLALACRPEELCWRGGPGVNLLNIIRGLEALPLRLGPAV